MFYFYPNIILHSCEDVEMERSHMDALIKVTHKELEARYRSTSLKRNFGV